MQISARAFRVILPLGLMAGLGACSGGSAPTVDIDVIGAESAPFETGIRLSEAGRLVRAATAEGLVALDEQGRVIPAFADRWIVTDDGLSYIFRLRRAFWANGARVAAPDVARMLMARIESLRRLDPDGPLDAVQAVIPMTGEVIEIRLATARPYILQMLAQPQMAIVSRDGGTGPYRRKTWGKAIILTPIDRLSDDDDAEDTPVPAWPTRVLCAERAALAIVRFREGQAALVLGGRLADLPLLVPAGVDRDAVRADPVQGLLGLAVTGRGSLLDDDGIRAAINMAIDRSQIPALLPIGGWATSNRIVPDQLDLGRAPTDPDWAALSLEDRRGRASAAVAVWRDDHGDPPPLRIALPQGPGATLLFGLLRRDLDAIGLPVRRVSMTSDAELRLIDEVAAYDSALWYLGRVGCARKIHCSDAADAQLQAASLASTPEDRAARIAEAEALMVAHNGYIPLGTPIRWSLVSRRLNGFQPSPRARHPLNHLFRRTN